MTGGGGLLVTLVIDFYRNGEDDEESRVSIYTRAMLLIVDELQPYTRMRVFLSLSPALLLSVSLSVAINVDVAAAACLLPMMMMRGTESNDDAPDGCGTRRNATIKRARQGREQANATKKTYVRPPSISFYPTVRSFFPPLIFSSSSSSCSCSFSFFPVIYE